MIEPTKNTINVFFKIINAALIIAIAIIITLSVIQHSNLASGNP